MSFSLNDAIISGRWGGLVEISGQSCFQGKVSLNSAESPAGLQKSQPAAEGWGPAHKRLPSCTAFDSPKQWEAELLPIVHSKEWLNLPVTFLSLSAFSLNPSALNWELRGPWAPSAPQHSQSLLRKPTLPTPFLLHFCLFFIHPYTVKICTELCTWSLPGVCKTNIPLRWLTSSQAQSIPVPDLDPRFKQQKGEVKNRNTNTGTFR